MTETIAVLFAIAMMFVALPAVVLHYITRWKATGGGLQPDDEHMLEDVWRSTRAMERRIEALEAILDAEAPKWRSEEERMRRNEERGRGT